MISAANDRLNMPRGVIVSSMSPGTFSDGIDGMPLKPPSGAWPIFHSGPAVEFTRLNRISVTVSVITPMYTSDSRP